MEATPKPQKVGKKSPDQQPPKRKTPPNYKVTKRVPQRAATQRNEIYVSTRSNFRAQLNRAQNLLKEKKGDVVILGLGAAIEKAMELALKIKRKNLHGVELHPTTQTVDLVDDLEPEDEDLKASSQKRTNSAIRIVVKWART